MINKMFSNISTDQSPLFLRHVYLQPARPHLKQGGGILPKCFALPSHCNPGCSMYSVKTDAVRMHSKWHLVCGFYLTLLQNISSQFEHSPHAQ